MLAALRRHPIPIRAFFRHSLVLTYAYPEEILRPLLPSGLTPDAYQGHGFVAIALVQTENLRPVGLPAFLGRSFFLAGYRIFTRFRRPDGKSLRGLYILRSYTDSRLMAWGGNLLTHYRYSSCAVETCRDPEALEIRLSTPGTEADLSVRAVLEPQAAAPPPGSPFPDLETARRYAGPLPFTFDCEPQARQMVVIEGVRKNWHPQLVGADVTRSTFLERPPFDRLPPRLASAFFVESIPYLWKRGVVMPLSFEDR